MSLKRKESSAGPARIRVPRKARREETLVSSRNVALVYDRVNGWGGAERVLLALHEMFPEASLYTSVYNKDKAQWANVFPEVVPSFLQKVPLVKSRHDLFPYLMPLAFESFDFSEYDLVISVTSEAAKGIITKPGTRHICYCLTPTRYLWSGYNEYFNNALRRTLGAVIVPYLRRWDIAASSRPDVMIGISKEVVNRIRQFYSREAALIYPPVKRPEGTQVSNASGDYFLVVSRLVPYKKVNLVVELFNQMKNKKLVIVGSGSESQRLQKMAKTNITFTGNITDEELANYYANCKALIFPQCEDFGIVAVEAQAFGKPVIAYSRGGALETVIDGKTGVFFDEQSAESLRSTIQRFESMEFNPQDCINNADKFSMGNFKNEFATLVKLDG